MKNHCYIAGEWRTGEGDLENSNPSEISDLIGIYAQAGPEQLGIALKSSKAAEEHVSFGGRGDSSYGIREQGGYSKEFYTTVNTAYIAAGEPA